MQGSNGEYVYLSTEERVEMVKRVRKLAPKEKLIIAGSGCECKNCMVCHLRGLYALVSCSIRV